METSLRIFPSEGPLGDVFHEQIVKYDPPNDIEPDFPHIFNEYKCPLCRRFSKRQYP